MMVSIFGASHVPIYGVPINPFNQPVFDDAIKYDTFEECSKFIKTSSKYNTYSCIIDSYNPTIIIFRFKNGEYTTEVTNLFMEN